MALNTLNHHHQSPATYSSNDDQRYLCLNIINGGSYGVVYRVLDKKTNEIVAIKHELNGLSRETLREIGILKCLPPHPNVIQLKDVIVEDRSSVFVVMEYVEADLHKLINGRRAKGGTFSLIEVNYLMKKILEGVAFIHDYGVMHRDLKPENILISADLSLLKICDFGLSRPMDSLSGSYTPGLGTYWYRAPELLHGMKKYSTEIDMWSVGCIMAELVLGKVAFPGESEIQQLLCIKRTLSSLLREKVAPLLSDPGMDLLQRLLNEESNQRITAKDALNHVWFQEDSYGFV